MTGNGSEDTRLRLAEAVRAACIRQALAAYEQASMDGLCHEGAWEVAVDAMRGLDLAPLIAALPQPGA